MAISDFCFDMQPEGREHHVSSVILCFEFTRPREAERGVFTVRSVGKFAVNVERGFPEAGCHKATGEKIVQRHWERVWLQVAAAWRSIHDARGEKKSRHLE